MKNTTNSIALLAALGLAAAGSAVHAEQLAIVVERDGVQTLALVDTITPNQAAIVAPISGLAKGEKLLGLDYRPLTRSLYAVGSSNRLYIVDRHSAVATPVSGLPFVTSLDGEHFGFDFNPTIDRIRNVSDANQNLVLNPLNGALQLVATQVFYTMGDPNFGMDPTVVHHAYDNNFVGAATSQLYAIDAELNVLVKQANNAGTLNTVGSLGVDFEPVGGFDISGRSGVAWAISTEGGTNSLGLSTLYQVDLSTGATNWMGFIYTSEGEELSVTAMTVVPFRDCPCDYNHDGVVDGSDLGMMLSAWGTTDDLFDVNDDNLVDGADWGILGATWGPCP
ncbi:MAG TPA: DUF4394 domain-containing protein [Phycisphaerales bacterium]|nr:DUF4394 domain-containing protein [Phycisphaerales bacterium]HMP38197.1 DUF4394 domain-containing protein [Phycisphaerales bacterium]